MPVQNPLPLAGGDPSKIPSPLAGGDPSKIPSPRRGGGLGWGGPVPICHNSHMPTLVEQLESDMKQAMRDRDRPRLSAIRMMRSALQNAAIAKGPSATLDDTEAADVLAREARQRKESIDEFRKAGRDDGLADQETELAVVMAYLPERLSKEEITEEARKIIDDLGARSMTDRGRVMGALMPVMRGRADGRDVSEVVQQLLSQ